ncbi:sugar transferase [Phenylobacterium conjunctum]
MLDAMGPASPLKNPERVTSAPFGIQRVLDVVLSLGALIFFAPLMIGVALAIKVQDGGPIFFGQDRVGFGGRTFKCLKFRSMVVDAEARLAAVLADNPELRSYWESHRKLLWDPRVTWLGQMIRKTSVDELPQLINVLRGDMSLVGPRPIMISERDLYGRWLARYCTMRPGITCLWQIAGRSHLSFRQRIALDMLYRRRRSPMTYIDILIRTVPVVLLRRGIV